MSDLTEARYQLYYITTSINVCSEQLREERKKLQQELRGSKNKADKSADNDDDGQPPSTIIIHRFRENCHIRELTTMLLICSRQFQGQARGCGRVPERKGSLQAENKNFV